MPGSAIRCPACGHALSSSTSPRGRSAFRNHHRRPGASLSRPAASCFESPRRPNCWRSRGRRCTSSYLPAKSKRCGSVGWGPSIRPSPSSTWTGHRTHTGELTPNDLGPPSGVVRPRSRMPASPVRASKTARQRPDAALTTAAALGVQVNSANQLAYAGASSVPARAPRPRGAAGAGALVMTRSATP